jgi:signal transduction histidine kinase
MDACVAGLRGLAELQRIRVRTSHGEGAAVISGNPAALRRLFLVLLDNALKYSHADSDVIVVIGREAGRLAVTIEDFGIGIPEADQPHLFKRFYQADKARTGDGFGLGLSLAESIARAHNATIDVRSVEGAGSTFRVCFTPLDTEEAMVRTPEYQAERN